MFSKSADPISEPKTTLGNAVRSIIGPDLIVTGEVSSTGVIEVLGQVDGNVKASTLSLGQNGRIHGEVRAQSLDVTGTLEGKIDSDTFTLRSGGLAKADVTYKAVIIEAGAQVEGRFTRKGE